ncbi:unnamed protein product [Parnassius mnemosyne]|uniref:HTH CENPB-type domain-containing protein n=1 Tax=Parnassius mnemosyne TaxID=213953 RepID=A0AAV1K9P1_9NEOP
MDQAVLSWFHRQCQNNMTISVPIVKAKAEKFGKDIGLTSFKSSEGWLGKFKQRHHINYENLQTYIEVDDCLLTTALFTDKEILDLVRKTDDQEQRRSEDEPEPPPIIKEALEAAKLLEKYFLYHQDDSISQDMNKISKKIQHSHWCSKIRHTKITDYTQ